MAGLFGAGVPWIVSPADRGDRFLARLLARTPKEDEDAEAQVRWGKTSDFIAALSGQQVLPTVTTVNWPDFPGGEDDEDPEEQVLDWHEMARTTSDVRVENPDDADQYVIVQRVETITFQTAEGRRVRLNFRNEETA